MQKYRGKSTYSRMVYLIEDYILKTFANTYHIACPNFKAYFVTNRAALYRGDYQSRGKLKDDFRIQFTSFTRCHTSATTYPTTRIINSSFSERIGGV